MLQLIVDVLFVIWSTDEKNIDPLGKFLFVSFFWQVCDCKAKYDILCTPPQMLQKTSNFATFHIPTYCCLAMCHHRSLPHHRPNFSNASQQHHKGHNNYLSAQHFTIDPLSRCRTLPSQMSKQTSIFAIFLIATYRCLVMQHH